MKDKYKIRKATIKDTPQIRQMIRESVAYDKKLINPSSITTGFIEEFVDKVIEKGNMVVVENDHEEMELIGEIHLYNNIAGGQNEALKELAFISRNVFNENSRETELVNWLVREIQSRHQDVFRVKLSAPVCNLQQVDYFMQLGLRIEGKYSCRLSNKSGSSTMVVPVSWINAAQN